MSSAIGIRFELTRPSHSLIGLLVAFADGMLEPDSCPARKRIRRISALRAGSHDKQR